MLRKFVEKLKRLTVEPVAFDPSGLDDDLALQIEWGPAKRGGANFGTHKLVEIDPVRAEFKATPSAVAFYLLFLLIGLGMIIGFTFVSLTGIRPPGWNSAFPILLPLFIGSVFTVVGGCMLYYGAAPIVFDKRRGDYWQGRVAPSEVSNRRDLEHHTKLDRIHALQIVSEHCRSNKSSYYSYELNLVLHDGTRINVIDHGDRDQMRKDAETLGLFLGKPVWDATR